MRSRCLSRPEEREGADRIGFADAGDGFADIPFTRKAERQLEQMVENARAKFAGDAVGGEHAQKLREDLKPNLEQGDSGENGDHNHQRGFALKGQDAVDNDLKDERLHQPQQAQADGEEDQLQIEGRELPQRLAEPGKWDFSFLSRLQITSPC